MWFDFDFSSTHTEFVDLPTGQNSVPQSPVTILSLGPTLRFDNSWFGGLRLRHFGPRPLIEDKSVRSDGTTQVNMQVGWQSGAAACDATLRLP